MYFTRIVLFDSLLVIKHWIVDNVKYYDMRLYELCRYEYEITDFYKKSCAFEFYSGILEHENFDWFQ